jgi:hypothetical protein
MADDLNRLTFNAFQSDNDVDSVDSIETNHNLNQSEPRKYFKRGFSTSPDTLYARDVIKLTNLTFQILNYDLITNNPPSLYIQDKYFFVNIFNTLNRLIDDSYSTKLEQYFFLSSKNHNQTTQNDSQYFYNLLNTINKYLNSIIDQKHDNRNQITSSIKNIEIILKNVQFILKQKEQFDLNGFETTLIQVLNTRIQLVLYQNNKQIDKISYLSLNIHTPVGITDISSNFDQIFKSTPRNDSEIDRKPLNRFKISTNLLILNFNVIKKTSNESMIQIKEKNDDDESTIIINIEFNLLNSSVSKSFSQFTCVSLLNNKNSNRTAIKWTNSNAKFISFNELTNRVTCQYIIDSQNHQYSTILTVLTPTRSSEGLDSLFKKRSPIGFTIPFQIIQPIVLVLILFTVIILAFSKQIQNALTIVYCHLALATLMLQIIFLFGINNNRSYLLCKSIAVLLHFFQLVTYCWIFLISVHLYRMITELRDINKSGTRPPLIYYAFGYLLPAAIIILTLSIKQNIYTNYSFLDQISTAIDSSYLMNANLYCWLNVSSFEDVCYVLVLPICILVVAFVVTCLVAYRESVRDTFKQTDIKFVQKNLITSFILLAFVSLTTFSLIMLIYTSTNTFIDSLIISKSNQIESQMNSSNLQVVYQYVYTLVSICNAITFYFILIIYYKYDTFNIVKVFDSIRTCNVNEKTSQSSSSWPNSLSISDDSENQISKTNLNFHPRPVFIEDAFFNNNNNKNTKNDNIITCNKKNLNLSPELLSHLANTTTTDSTFDIDQLNMIHGNNDLIFGPNSDPIRLKNEMIDVVDVGKLTKAKKESEKLNILSSVFTLSPPDQFNDNHKNGITINKFNTNNNTTGIASMPLFWPSVVANCGVSLLDDDKCLNAHQFSEGHLKNIEEEEVEESEEDAGFSSNNSPQLNSNFESHFVDEDTAYYNNNSNNDRLNIFNTFNCNNNNNSSDQMSRNRSFVPVLTHTGSPSDSSHSPSMTTDSEDYQQQNYNNNNNNNETQV